MNKNIKRIIATTLVVCAFSAIEPVQYMNLTTTKAYASSNREKREKREKRDKRDKKDKFNKDNFDDLKINEESGSDKIQLYSKSNCKSDDETDFDFSDTTYYAKVSKGTSSVNITADNDSDYEVYVFKGNNKKKYDLGDEIDIDSGTTTLYVRAYKDGDFDKDNVKRDVKKTYTIYVKNGSNSNSSSDSGTTDEDKDQDDIYLKDLRLNEGKIDFSKDKTSYDVDVKESIDEIEITAKPEDKDYTVKIDGSKVDDSDKYKKTVELKKGKNAIEISIKNGSDKRIYTLNINRGTTSSSTNTTENNKPTQGDKTNTVERPTQINKKAQQWVTVNGNWQYNDENGNPLKSAWLRDKNSGKWYFLDADANMATGWLYTGGVWYYLDNSGAMQTGWLKLDGKWYYLDTNGVMRTQWIKVDGKYYYLNESGVMRYDTIINGYKLDASGAWIG